MRVFQDPTTGTYTREDGAPGYPCARCGNGYASAETRDDTDAHTCEGLTGDIASFDGARGLFAQGYDEGDIAALNNDIHTTQFVCVWSYYDNLGFGGDSEIVGRDIRPDGTPGPWQPLDPTFWRFLHEDDTTVTIDDVQAFLAEDLFEVQNVEDLPVFTGTNAAYTDATA